MATTRSLLDIARLEEGHCAMTLHEIAANSLAIGGGYATRGAKGSWVNRAEGLGMAGVVTREDVDRLVEWYESAGMEAQIKVCPYADASLIGHLRDVGFVVKRFEQLLHRELSRGERIDSPRELPGDIEIRVVDRVDEARMWELATVKYRCFAPPAAAAAPVNEGEVELSARCMRRPRAVTIGAYHGGVCIGGGGVEMLGEIAGLYGGAVDAAYRGRGVQQAIIAARLNHAIARGATIATMGSDPGGGSERNARRFGFMGTYTKIVMVKPRPK